MPDQPPRYRQAFLGSSAHAWLALLTVGAGILSAQPLGLIAGAVGYVIGWVFLPDSGWFRGRIDRRIAAAAAAAHRSELQAFATRRQALIDNLPPRLRSSYAELVRVCQDLESATADAASPADDPAAAERQRKLEELMWTYLRLLGIDASLDRFLESEHRENLPGLVRTAEREVADLHAQVASATSADDASRRDLRERLLTSRLEHLDVLRKRLARIDHARGNLEVVRAEQERLEQQVKLIRADAFATKNAGALSSRIDATVAQLDSTNRWLSQLEEFKDVVGSLPATPGPIGFGTLGEQPPPLPTTTRATRTRSQS